jgi:hypothetical protein
MNNDIDPIWGLPAVSTGIGSLLTQYSSDRAGQFATSPGLSEFLQNWSDHDKGKLSSWILDHNRGGGVPVVKPEDMSTIRARRSLGFFEKVDRFLLMLEADKFRPGDPLPWRAGVDSHTSVRARDRTMLWIEAASEQEFYAFRPALIDAAVLKSDQTDGLLRLGPRGYARMEELRSVAANTDQGFVAMWFGEAVSDAYTKGIEPALADAGYRAMRIDRKEHNNKIDDEILAEIRRSRFMVADFTCGLADTGNGPVAIPRGGVYYEAGFAQGLGIPVIWCVRVDQVGHVHFDTRQFNHVTWTTPEDLRERLSARIAASIGWGPRAMR